MSPASRIREDKTCWRSRIFAFCPALVRGNRYKSLAARDLRNVAAAKTRSEATIRARFVARPIKERRQFQSVRHLPSDKMRLRFVPLCPRDLSMHQCGSVSREGAVFPATAPRRKGIARAETWAVGDWPGVGSRCQRAEGEASGASSQALVRQTSA